MFKNKTFTIVFSILAVLIVALSALLIYLVFGKSSRSLNQSSVAVSSTAVVEETTTVEEKEKQETVRPLSADEEHTYPILNEEIPEKGSLKIIKSGDNGEGIVFHKLPLFDGEDAEGNKSVTSGTFDIVAKIYINENGRPYLMYKTEDGYYVTSNKTYVSYESDQGQTITPDLSNITSYGYNEDKGVCVDVYSDDGIHVVFSIFSYDMISATATPVLSNVIAEYDSKGIADFEYVNSDGKVHTGTIQCSSITGTYISKQVNINFSSGIAFTTGTKTEVTLHN